MTEQPLRWILCAAVLGFRSKYEEVNADHAGMSPLVLPDIFDFFDASRGK
jgi:hypothetical protein